MARCALILVLLSLGACQLAPPHRRPELPVSSTWPAEYAGDVTQGRTATEVSWREFFVDPRLRRLIESALQHNRDLIIATAQIEEARGLYRIQRADRLPTVTASGEATRTRVGPESAAAAGSSSLPSSGGTATVDRYSIGVGVASFELDFWGRVRNLSEAARADYLATEAAARAFRLSLIREVAQAYLAARESEERLQLAQATVNGRQEELRIAQRRLDAGVTSALDYRQAETLLTQAETELAALRLSKAQDENYLVALVGAPLEASLPPALPLSKQSNAAPLAAGIPSQVLVNRPDIVSAEEQLRAARANIGAARAAFFPSITLTGSFGYASSDLDALVGTDAKTWSHGPAISVPLFDFGRRRGNLAVAKARETIAVADYERTIQTAFQEVSDALAGRRYLSEQIAAQQRGVLAQRRLADFARIRYREGVIRYIEVLDAERSLFAAEQALLQVQRAEAANTVALFVALGGGGM